MTEQAAAQRAPLAESPHAEGRGLLLGFIGVAVFSLTLPVTRLAMADSDPVVFGLGRSLLAGAVAAAILLATRQRRPRGREWRALALVAAGVIFGFPLLSAWGMQLVPAAHGGVVLGILPVATAVAGAVLLRERPSTAFWLVSLAGGAAVVGFSLLRGGGLSDWAIWRCSAPSPVPLSATPRAHASAAVSAAGR